MDNYDNEAAGLNRALQRKSFHNVRAQPQLKVPGAMEIDPGEITLVFADNRQEFGEYEELLRKIEFADSEEAIRESFDVE